MKRFALPVSLAVLVFAQACMDATSPDRHATLTPTNPHAVLGNVPPPPTRSAVVISVASSDVLVGEFTGVYFASGGSSSSAAAADELADATLAWNGTAWLRLDNTQTLGSLASANARFQVTRGLTTDPNFSGRGTLTISGHKITIDRVTFFAPNPDCLPGALCATIEFDASVDGIAGHHGTVQAFDRAVCTSVSYPDPDAEEGISSIDFCPFGSEG
jgi:hypothetical protein